MPRKVEIDAYTFDELEGTAKDRARSWWVETLDHFWYRDIIDCWVDDLAEKGIITTKTEIQFSGFSTQGDGASFTCTFDLPKFMLYTGLANDYLKVYAEAVSGEDIVYRITRQRSHYVHDNTMLCDYSVDTDIIPDDVACNLSAGILEHCRTLAKMLYSELEKEYDYMQSDEYIKEGCEANDYLFDKHGRII